MKHLKKAYAAILALGLASAAMAQTTPTNYGTVLEGNLTTIETIWAAVATIMIAVALVSVGVRFFRKAR